MIVRSYRRVFEVDRRIYRVDRWALPVPGGVPLRGGRLLRRSRSAVLVLGALPGIGELVGRLSPPLRYVVVPLAVAVLGTQAAPDGRGAPLRGRLAAAAAARPAALGGPRGAARGRAGRVGRARWRRCGTSTRPELASRRVRGPARVTFNGAGRADHGPGGRLVARGRRGAAR